MLAETHPAKGSSGKATASSRCWAAAAGQADALRRRRGSRATWREAQLGRDDRDAGPVRGRAVAPTPPTGRCRRRSGTATPAEACARAGTPSTAGSACQTANAAQDQACSGRLMAKPLGAPARPGWSDPASSWKSCASSRAGSGQKDDARPAQRRRSTPETAFATKPASAPASGCWPTFSTCRACRCDMGAMCRRRIIYSAPVLRSGKTDRMLEAARAVATSLSRALGTRA